MDRQTPAEPEPDLDVDMSASESGDRPHKDLKDSELREATTQCEALIKQMETLQLATGAEEARVRLAALKEEKWRRRPQGMQLLIAQSGVKKASATREKLETQLLEAEEEVRRLKDKIAEARTTEQEAVQKLDTVRSQAFNDGSGDGGPHWTPATAELVASTASEVTSKLDTAVTQAGLPLTKDVVQEYMHSAMRDILRKLHAMAEEPTPKPGVAAAEEGMNAALPTQVDSTAAGNLDQPYGKQAKERERSEPYGERKAGQAAAMQAPSSPSVLAGVPAS